MVDALGNLARFVLLPGQRHDSIGVEPLLDGVEIGALIGDKGFDNDWLRRDYRRIATRYDKTDQSFAAMINLVALRLALR